MNKTQEEFKQKTLEAIAPDIGEMLEHYDEVLEPEDPMSLPAERRGGSFCIEIYHMGGLLLRIKPQGRINTRIERIEAMWGQVKARTDLHIAKLMNELAGGVVEKELIKKKKNR